MTIKSIFDRIAAESSTNKKVEILQEYKPNLTLQRALYLANSKRIKFYIKQFPAYTPSTNPTLYLDQAMEMLASIYNRQKTGEAAKQFLVEIVSALNPDDAYIIERIIDKDCRMNLGTTLINKVFPKLIEETPYMGAVSYDKEKVLKLLAKGKAFSQVKMDGRYNNAIIWNGEVESESRQGESAPLFDAKFTKELANFPDCVLNGELTMKGTPRYESNGIIASLIDVLGKQDKRTAKENAKKLEAFTAKHGDVRTILDSILFTVWDVIDVDEYFNQYSKVPYFNRLERLKGMLADANCVNVQMVESRLVHSYDEASKHFQELLANGEEGTILKAYDGEWKDGKPSHQIKFKLEMDVDLRIVGFNFGTGKNANVVSSLNAQSSDGLVTTRPTGITEELMQYITDNRDKLLGTILEVKCSGLSMDRNGNYSLLHPCFKRFRDDKDECDSLESIIAIERMAKECETIKK